MTENSRRTHSEQYVCVCVSEWTQRSNEMKNCVGFSIERLINRPELIELFCFLAIMA